MAIGTPTTIGTNNIKASTGSIAVTVPAGGVPAGAQITVGVVTSDLDDARSVTDTAGNTYVLDGQQVRNTNLNLEVFRASNVAALSAGDTITYTIGAGGTVNVAVISAFYCTGLATSSPLDGSPVGAAGSSVSPNSGALATANADDLMVGFIGVQGPGTDSFTQDAGPAFATPPDADGTIGSSAATNISVRGGAVAVASTGSYDYSPTIGTSRPWVALILGYKATAGGSGIGDGSSSGTGAASGVGASTAASMGTGTGVGAASGVGSGTVNSAGAAAGTGAASGAASSLVASSGTISGVGAASGIGASLSASAGTSAGVGAASGIGSSLANSAGTSDGTGAASGVGSSIAGGAGTGTSAGVGAASGVGASISQSAGSAAGIGSASAVIAALAKAAGSANGVASGIAVGFAGGITDATGTASGIAVASGAGDSFAWVPVNPASGTWTPVGSTPTIWTRLN